MESLSFTHKNDNSSDSPSLSLNNQFYVNPVISCRVEDEEGAILFNPDLNSTILINASGLALWEFIHEPRMIGDISSFLKNTYDDCPDEENIVSDVMEFLSGLLPDYVIEEETGV